MKLTAILSALVLVLALSACTARSADTNVTAAQPAQEQQVSTTEQQATQPQTVEQTQTQLTRDEAVAIALKAAGLENSDVWDLDTERERERGTVVWEVDFEFEYQEYSYVLDAQTGEILYEEVERD